MPGNVRAGQVISLVEVTGGLGSDHRRLASRRRAGSEHRGPPPHTRHGRAPRARQEPRRATSRSPSSAQSSRRPRRDKVRLLTDHLAKIEPFKTAMELASEVRGGLDEQVARSLSERGISWHHDPELNESLLRTILIHWAIYAGLLTYNKNGKFEPVKTIGARHYAWVPSVFGASELLGQRSAASSASSPGSSSCCSSSRT